ncbi:MAG: NAD-glutamate dehydrogenase [Candidatus Omnitrophica bacterium]|nr:NAD-glutamate dehydrogenase [Candidatus Omnitrophota bacterium]
MKRQYIKAILLVVTLSFIIISSGYAITGRDSRATLAPYSMAEIVDKYKDEVASFDDMDARGYGVPAAYIASDFANRWIYKHARVIAKNMANRFRDLLTIGYVNISEKDALAEFEAAVHELAVRYDTPKQREEILIEAIRSEFKEIRGKERLLPERPISTEPIEWLSVEDATKRLNALSNIGNIAELDRYWESLEAEGILHEEFYKRLRPELAQMSDILKRTRPVDELNKLADENKLVFKDRSEDPEDPAMRDRQIMRIDILRSVSELILQLLPVAKNVDNLKHLQKIRQVFAKYPCESALLVKYFETRFDPSKRLDERGEAAGIIRLELLKMLREIKTEEPEEHYIFEKALGIMIATVKTDYFVEDRTSLFFGINPRAIVRDDEDGALVQTPPYMIIWVHVPYGAYGAHSRYLNVARGGLRMINPGRANMRDKILHECVALSITQNKKHTDIPEGGSKGAFIYGEGLNAVGAAIGYVDGLINCMMDNERIAVSSGASAIDPLELGPDEGTAPLANLITARAMMKGLETWRLLMTGKSQILGGVSHMENNLLDPHEKGNRVTSQGVTQHAFEMVRYLREARVIKSEEGEPVAFSITGGLDGDVASGLVERTINNYGDNAVIRGIVDGSGVMFDPMGLDHGSLLTMYANKSMAIKFPKDKLHKGGFVAAVTKDLGAGEENYIVLDSDTLAHMNTRALDPQVLKELDVDKQYRLQAKLKEDEPLMQILERDAGGRPSKVRVHTVYLRNAMFFLVKSDMLITGGGVSNSINQNNWPLFFDEDGRPVSSAITHGANVFTHKEANINLEKKGVVIEPDEKANSVGVEISSRMEVDFNSIFDAKDMRRNLMAAYFEQVLAKCLENARAKFWALRIEAEDRPDESVVVRISSEMSAEIIRLAEHISKSHLVGDRRSDYSDTVIERLKEYFPDVSGLDKEYPGTLDRVFARMSTERLKAIASKMIAKEVVQNLGTNGVSELAVMAKVKDVDIIDQYLKASQRLNTVEKIMGITDNKDGLPPSSQITALREERRKLKFAIEEALASTDAVIDDVSKLTNRSARHMLLRPDGSIELSSIAIVMNKDLAESVTGRDRMNGARGMILQDRYRVMKQELRRTFASGEGLFEVSDKDELVSRVNELIARGMKVVILDDGTITKDLNPGNISGKAGEKFCLISSSVIEEDDEAVIPFVNLNAMAMMGVGIIHDDLTLFETAYEIFTGKDLTQDLIAKLVNKVLWLVRALPRCIKITDDLSDQEKLKKLFDVAA